QPNRMPIIFLDPSRPTPPFPNHRPRGRQIGRVLEHRAVGACAGSRLVVVADHDGDVMVTGDRRASAAARASHYADALALRASTRRTPAPVVPAHLVT